MTYFYNRAVRSNTEGPLCRYNFIQEVLLQMSILPKVSGPFSEPSRSCRHCLEPGADAKIPVGYI